MVALDGGTHSKYISLFVSLIIQLASLWYFGTFYVVISCFKWKNQMVQPCRDLNCCQVKQCNTLLVFNPTYKFCLHIIECIVVFQQSKIENSRRKWRRHWQNVFGNH